MIPKFRAWDKENKKMLVVNDICNLFWENTFFECYELVPDPKGKREYELINHRIDFEDCVFMQSTGLVDKNGQEIFEGDIVHAYSEDARLIGTIEYFDNAYCIKTKNGVYNSLWINAEYYEVIGNIYENPELLEEETNDQ